MTDLSASLTPLRRIQTPKGDVLHGIKATDETFAGFGEAYFSIILGGQIKGWKRHRKMTLNLVCPVGAVRFMVHTGTNKRREWLDVTLSPNTEDQYSRLTVPPMHWFAFEGVEPGENMILNIASIPHDPEESENLDLSAFLVGSDVR